MIIKIDQNLLLKQKMIIYSGFELDTPNQTLKPLCQP